MGLPLWQPRVESDIPSRPEAKNPAHARSRIRSASSRDPGATAIRERPAARNGELRSRDRRRALIQEMQERLISSNSNNSSSNNSSNNNSTPQVPDSPPTAGEARRSLSAAIEREQGEIRALLARRRSIMAGDRAPPSQGTTGSEEDHRRRLSPLPRPERGTGTLTNAERNLHTERLAVAHDRARMALQRTRRLHDLERMRARALERGSLDGTAGQGVLSQPAVPVGVDGLGDRDRSLSPENDNAWDTLLTTVTPDPQPPSAGSSFTSMMSAVTRIGFSESMNRSSSTSFTGPDTAAEDSGLEQPCESDDDVDPISFEVELADGSTASARFPGVAGSYADVVRLGNVTGGGSSQVPRTLAPPLPRLHRHSRYNYHNAGHLPNASEPDPYRTLVDRPESASDDLILQLVGGLGGMQHIVRNLARREDIPNDWWVDAGLSRALPRDGSADDESTDNNAGTGVPGNNGSSNI